MRDVLTKNTDTEQSIRSTKHSSFSIASVFHQHVLQHHFVAQDTGLKSVTAACRAESHCLFVLAPAVTSVICYCFPLSRCMRRVAGCGARFSLLFPSLRVKSFQLFLPFPLRARLSVGRRVRTAVPSQWTMGPPCSSVSRCDNLGHKPLNCYLGSNES